MHSDEDTSRIIRRLLRVNHSGEHGAVAIYSSQIAGAKKRYPEILPWLEETLSHEIQHRAAFLDAMPARNAKPCRAMYVWKHGGAVLGWITSLFGKSGVMICTAAVERTVHGHLVEQIAFLRTNDPQLAETVSCILSEEDQHLEAAERQHNSNSFFAKLLSSVVSLATETLILVSTRGDSLRLRAKLSKS
ncbi:demethoxyubiquinone hydroxylase family protein [Hyphococcus sp.]|uniref:demethoxyubiquinone hydroxylase family protein n=1 Tax=Hyphococcus sp. TaxID=2038636 RepID=UPI003CCBC3CE